MSSLDIDPIHRAVMRHDLAGVTSAISQGLRLDVLDRTGRTPLFYAAKDGDLAIVSELLRHGADVNAADKDLKTPLHFAASNYQPEVAMLLLSVGAKVDAQDVHGNTPLSDAIFESKGRGQVIKVLSAAGGSWTLSNKHGVSPLNLAKSIRNFDLSAFIE